MIPPGTCALTLKTPLPHVTEVGHRLRPQTLAVTVVEVVVVTKKKAIPAFARSMVKVAEVGRRWLCLSILMVNPIEGYAQKIGLNAYMRAQWI